MRGVCRPEPKFLAVFTNVNARRFSAISEIPVGFFQFERDVTVGQNRSSWRFFPVQVRGVIPSGAKFLAIYPSLESFFGRGQRSWRYVPIRMRGAFRSEPNFLAVLNKVNARRNSVRTHIPGVNYQAECEALFGQDRNSWRYLLV